MFFFVSSVFQWKVYGEIKQEWRPQESGEDRSDVFPFHSMYKLSFSFPVLLWTKPSLADCMIVGTYLLKTNNFWGKMKDYYISASF